MTDTTNRRLRACIAACEGIETEVLESLGRGGLKDERDLCDHLLTKMEVILVRTVNAIRGEPEPLHRHGWHDLPERAQAVMAALGMAMEVAAETVKGRSPADVQATPDGRVGEIIEQLRAVCEDGCPPGLPLEAADAMEILVEQRDAARKRTAALLVERDALSVEFDALRNQQPVAWATRLGVPLYAHPVPAQSVPDDLIDAAVNRFMTWKLPKNFSPDAGISFQPVRLYAGEESWWPMGTNLFTTEQAREMFRHALAKEPEVK